MWDVPASRKLCWFYGHMANLGCNKCEKKFPGVLGEKHFVVLTEALGPQEQIFITGKFVGKFQNVL